MLTIAFLLAIVALVLGVVEQFEAQGRSKLAWAVICLALIHVLATLRLG